MICSSPGELGFGAPNNVVADSSRFLIFTFATSHTHHSTECFVVRATQNEASEFLTLQEICNMMVPVDSTNSALMYSWVPLGRLQ